MIRSPSRVSQQPMPQFLQSSLDSLDLLPAAGVGDTDVHALHRISLNSTSSTMFYSFFILYFTLHILDSLALSSDAD